MNCRDLSTYRPKGQLLLLLLLLLLILLLYSRASLLKLDTDAVWKVLNKYLIRKGATYISIRSESIESALLQEIAGE